MRFLLLATSFLAFGLPFSRAFAQQRCAVPVSGPFTVSADVPLDPRILLPAPVSVEAPSRRPVRTVTTQAAARPSNPAPDTPLDGLNPAVKLSEAELITSPALAHIAAAGATLSELGNMHGLQTVFAKNDGQFMIFEVTPDHQATVTGLATELSVAQLKSLAGEDITPLPPEHGLDGYFVRNGARFQVFYAAPDGKAVIPGVMWDKTGKDITRAQVTSIPGAIPTVTIGDVPKEPQPVAAATEVGPDNRPAGLVEAAEHTTYGTIGSPTAPQLWMFIDPQCSFSIRAMQQLQPYVAAGRVQLHVIPLSILDGEDNGLSTRRALQLVSTSPDRMVGAWETGQTPADGSALDAGQKLQGNMAAASALRVQGTPTFVWRKQDGTTGRTDGIPQSIDAMLGAIGS